MKTFFKNISKIFLSIIDFFVDYKTIFAMIAVVLGLGLLIYGVCEHAKKENKKSMYYNVDLVIVGTNEQGSFTMDKFHKPINVKIMLVQLVSDTTQFCELKNYEPTYSYWRISNELWYSKKIGDTLHFDYIRKDRFFTIKR